MALIIMGCGQYTKVILTFSLLPAGGPGGTVWAQILEQCMMFAGRQGGSRSIEGLGIKTSCGREGAAAEQERDRELVIAAELWRAKTKQNLVTTILVTLSSVLLAAFAVHYATGLLEWSTVALAVAAPISTLITVTRRSDARAAAHRQVARQLTAHAAACRASVVRYEEGKIGDAEFQALLDQHVSERNALQKEAERI